MLSLPFFMYFPAGFYIRKKSQTIQLWELHDSLAACFDYIHTVIVY